MLLFAMCPLPCLESGQVGQSDALQAQLGSDSLENSFDGNFSGESPLAATRTPHLCPAPGSPQPSPDDDALVLGPAAPAAQHGVVGPAGHGEDVGRQHARLVVPVPLGDLRGKRWRSGGEGAEGRRGRGGGVRGDSPLSHTAAAAGRGSWR